MTTYKTGNPLGSTSVKDLYDNAENFDIALNERASRSWEDRLGATRKSWYGIEQDFQDFLLNSGYQDIGDYAPGLVVTARNQVFAKDGELWRASPSLALPYTTTGDWGTEGANFVSVGDAVLRQDLSNGTDTDLGVGLVVGAARVVDSIADLRLQNGLKNPHVIAIGYYTRGDNSPAAYSYDPADATTPDNGGTVIVSIYGHRYRLNQRGGITPYHFGAKGDGASDDTIAMQRFAAAQAFYLKRIPAGRFLVTEAIDFRPGDVVEGDGPNSVIVADSSGWTAEYVVGVTGALVAMPALSADIQRGASSFTAVSAPPIQAGDVGVIFNPANWSFSPWRTYYRAGEFFRVNGVAGNVVRMMGVSYAGYAAAQVTMHKLVGPSTRFSAFHIQQPPTQNSGLRVALIDTPIIRDITTSGSSTYCGIELDRCFDARVESNAFQASPAVDDEYGLLVSNCQGGTLTGAFYGGRHGIAFGGGSAAGSVPCRGITVMASSMGNNAPTGSQDLHGNTENILFIGGTFANGGIIGGRNHRFVGCSFMGNLNSGVALFAGEPLGGGANVFTNCHFESSQNPNTGGFGMVDLANNSTNLTADTTYQFDGCTFRAPVGCTYVVKSAIDGTPAKVNLVFNAARAINAPDVVEFIRLSKSAGTGSFGLVRVHGLTGFVPSGLKYVFLDGAVSADRFQLPRQIGVVTIPVSSGAASGPQAVSFPNPYPRAPNVLITARSPTVDNKRVAYSSASITANGFSATCYLTTDGAATGAASSGSATWESVLEE